MRAAALGLAAACGYALTATLLKSAVAVLPRGAAAFFSTWQLYATAVAGVGALFLLQNALQAGTLVAVQPPLTLGDALISVSYGVTVYGENVRTGGGLLVIQIAALIADHLRLHPAVPVAVRGPRAAARRAVRARAGQPRT